MLLFGRLEVKDKGPARRCLKVSAGSLRFYLRAPKMVRTGKEQAMKVSVILAVLAFCATGLSAEAGAPTLVAQGKTCSSFQTMCANRCRMRAPQDANCVDDHCTPKLNTCRQDGCWQEGRLYGGRKTCGLVKS
ncbi:MAG TPA: hypothetical protein PLQ11_07560 [Beijerinckiaceae bacterium]|nr:hypothetical protein [Beijerinckiaceae bacterium]